VFFAAKAWFFAAKARFFAAALLFMPGEPARIVPGLRERISRPCIFLLNDIIFEKMNLFQEKMNLF
jgi:hypothetical protein